MNVSDRGRYINVKKFGLIKRKFLLALLIVILLRLSVGSGCDMLSKTCTLHKATCLYVLSSQCTVLTRKIQRRYFMNNKKPL